MTTKEYHRNYMRQWSRNKQDIHMRLSQSTKLKTYYEEYKIHCQQNLSPMVSFGEFIIQFCEIGYLSWRDRNKGR